MRGSVWRLLSLSIVKPGVQFRCRLAYLWDDAGLATVGSVAQGGLLQVVSVKTGGGYGISGGKRVVTASHAGQESLLLRVSQGSSELADVPVCVKHVLCWLADSSRVARQYPSTGNLCSLFFLGEGFN